MMQCILTLLGDFHYIPILFHEIEKPHKQHKALFELYGLIIGDFQGTQPQSGILIKLHKQLPIRICSFCRTPKAPNSTRLPNNGL